MPRMTSILRQMLENNSILTAPGVFDGLSALLAKQAAFPVVYASGGAIARSEGLPDLGLLSVTEVCQRMTSICAMAGVPVIADADTGFGGSLNVQRTVREFERSGVAAFHLEDQTFPKRCGHLNDKSLIPMDEMCHKIRVAKKSLQDLDTVIIARTDAIAVEGFNNAIQRAQAYVKAGADVIFVEAPESLEQIELIAKQIPQPKLINMFYGGKTPLVATDILQELGYKIVIIPSDLQRAAIKAMQNTLNEIKASGNSAALEQQLTTFNERELIVNTKLYLEIDKV